MVEGEQVSLQAYAAWLLMSAVTCTFTFVDLCVDVDKKWLSMGRRSRRVVRYSTSVLRVQEVQG